MMSLQSKLIRIGQALAEITPNCKHYYRAVKYPPFLCWAEDGEGDSFNSGNHKTEQVISGSVDFFTLTEFDPLVDAVQEKLDALGLAWRLDSVDFEEDTNLIHYSWSFEVGDGADNV